MPRNSLMSCHCLPSMSESLWILAQDPRVPLAVVSSGDVSQGPRCCPRCRAALGPLEKLSPAPLWCSPLGLEGQRKAVVQLQAGEEADGDCGSQSQERRMPHLAGVFKNLFIKHLLSSYYVPGPALETQPWASRCSQADGGDRLIPTGEVRVPWSPEEASDPALGCRG